MARTCRRRRNRLRCTIFGWGRAREQEIRAVLSEPADGWGSDVCAGRPMDCGPSSHSSIERNAEQPWLSSGNHARATDVQRTQPRSGSRNDGSTLTDPHIDFAKIAQGMGLHAEGPITDPKDLGPALRRAA